MQRRLPAVIAHVPSAGSIVATAPCSCAGTAWVSTTPVAVVGPSLRTVIRRRSGEPTTGGSGSIAALTDTRLRRATATGADAASSPEVVSVAVVVTETPGVWVVPAAPRRARSVQETRALPPAGIVPTAPPGTLVETSSMPDGTGSTATTPVASDGPLLAIVAVTVVVSPGAIEAGEAASATDTPERDVGVAESEAESLADTPSPGAATAAVWATGPVASWRVRTGTVIAGHEAPTASASERSRVIIRATTPQVQPVPDGAPSRSWPAGSTSVHADRPRRRDRGRVGHREGVGGRRAAHE